MKINPIQPAFNIAEPGEAVEKASPRKQSIGAVSEAGSKSNQDSSERETEEGLNRLVNFLKRKKSKGDEQKKNEQKKRALSHYETSVNQETAQSLKGIKLDKSA